ncbi:hypothetical protein GCM10010232_55570 [Streptomyces amakusaensis]
MGRADRRPVLAGFVLLPALANVLSVAAASVLFTASFQATIAVGAPAGGVVVDRAAPSAVMVLGGTTAALAVLVIRSRRDGSGDGSRGGPGDGSGREPAHR